MPNITVLAPHIDDEIIGAGGSIAKHIDLGNVVRVIYVHSGDTPEEVRARESEAVRVADFLGIRDAHFLRQRPTSLTNQTVEEIVGLLRRHSADFLYAPHLDDGDIEHVAVSQIAHRLLWLTNGEYFREQNGRGNLKGLFLYEVHRPIGQVHYFEDITKYENKKIAAIRLYDSQIQRVRYDLSAIHLNRYRGLSSEVAPSAEAFQIAGARNFFELFGKR
ncbi:MAG TPA: PIG-L family deacetylase [Candidatus Nanoarchaeia archaeon]|nr:PIG-L family deacetylase [Candidatus Nanoarchaeia archaeon]